jgi:hypothetical protein
MISSAVRWNYPSTSRRMYLTQSSVGQTQTQVPGRGCSPGMIRWLRQSCKNRYELWRIVARLLAWMDRRNLSGTSSASRIARSCFSKKSCPHFHKSRKSRKLRSTQKSSPFKAEPLETCVPIVPFLDFLSPHAKCRPNRDKAGYERPRIFEKFEAGGFVLSCGG